MAGKGKGKAIGAAIKYGPLVYAAAQQYGPAVWEQVRTHREPAERMVQARVSKGNQRKKALAHAATLKSGSVLQVFHDNEAHWVVFTGDRPVAVHPASEATFGELLADADLTRRTFPSDSVLSVNIKRPRRKPRPFGGASRSASGSNAQRPGPSSAGRAQLPAANEADPDSRE